MHYTLLNLILSSAFILLNVLYLYLCSISSPCISFYFRHLIGFSATSSLTRRECSTSCTCVLALSVRTCLHLIFIFLCVLFVLMFHGVFSPPSDQNREHVLYIISVRTSSYPLPVSHFDTNILPFYFFLFIVFLGDTNIGSVVRLPSVSTTHVRCLKSIMERISTYEFPVITDADIRIKR